MNLLAIETATEACSIAVWCRGAVCERFEIAPRRHAALALPWAEALLAQAGIARAQLDAIGVGCGPGAFTGVRLAVSIAQGIALGLDLPVVPVSTLATLAMQAQPGEQVLAAIDARMGEIYVGQFLREEGSVRALEQERLIAPDQAPALDQVGWHGLGTGFSAAEGLLRQHWQARLAQVNAGALPHAADTARLAATAYAQGKGLAPEQVEPAYLRNQVALTLVDQARQRALRGQ